MLDESERATWKISSEDFGDIIFLLDEGAIFVPNFFSDFGCSAMHGYQPDLKSQRGIIASSVPAESIPVDMPVPAHRAYKLLADFYSQADHAQD